MAPSDTSSSDLSGYNSEEDRRAAYTESLHQKINQQKQASRQQELLCSYRKKMDWEQTRKRKLFNNSVDRTPHVKPHLHLQSETTDPLLTAQWEQHERRWQILESAEHSVVCRDDIPWPPESKGIVAAMVQHMLLRGRQQQASLAIAASISDSDLQQAHKQAYKAAMLRWHPDKFKCRLTTLSTSEQAAAMQKLQHVISDIFEWKENMFVVS